MPLKDYECFPVAPPSYPLELSSFIPDTITSCFLPDRVSNPCSRRRHGRTDQDLPEDEAKKQRMNAIQNSFADSTSEIASFSSDRHKSFHAFFSFPNLNVFQSENRRIEMEQMNLLRSLKVQQSYQTKSSTLDPPRNPVAQKAYDEMLWGLGMIGCQEFLVQASKNLSLSQLGRDQKRLEEVHETLNEKLQEDLLDVDDSLQAMVQRLRLLTGKTKGKKDVQMLHALEAREELKEMCKDLRPTDLHELARMERAWQYKIMAPIRRTWFEDMRARAGLSDKKTPRRSIRRTTFRYLSRPIEKDWSMKKFLFIIYTILSFIFTLYSQIATLTTLCSVAYICPDTANVMPIVAPPLAYRQASSYYETKLDSYYPYLQQTCAFSSSGCTAPGYKVQWPYMETERGSVGVPKEITSSCSLETGIFDYLWDPFDRTFRHGFYSCSKSVIPLQLPSNTTGQVASLHFDAEWYNQNRRSTEECFRKNFPNDRSPQTVLTRMSRDSADYLKLELCIAGSNVANGPQTCPCGYPTHWPLNLFYYGEDKLRVCAADQVKQTFEDGIQCTSDDFCSTKKCEIAFPDQQPLSTSSLYGCYFSSPTASSQTDLLYNKCGLSSTSTLAEISDQFAKVYKDKSLRSPLDSRFSSRTLLLLLFLIKEGGVLTAILVILIILLALGSLLLLPAIVLFLVYKLCPFWGCEIWIFCCTTCQNESIAKLNWQFVVDELLNVVYYNLRVLWNLCKNFSTMYRMTKLSYQIKSSRLNASVQELYLKLASMVNLVFNIVVIFLTDSSSGKSLLIISSILQTLTIFLVVNHENEWLSTIASALKDNNEHRLSKFEFALMVSKIMEDFLQDDISYNWVEHLRSSHPLLPVGEGGLMKDEIQEDEEKDQLFYWPTPASQLMPSSWIEYQEYIPAFRKPTVSLASVQEGDIGPWRRNGGVETSADVCLEVIQSRLAMQNTMMDAGWQYGLA
ncbi:hypothetical protein GUITHDRAFT_146998 [Guillardia theta CCMP2712]|uniref:Uncharacterized protein n=1 Tax=Guillardia theta (strain CCMP2712) TaxID=905079 RepID=L1IF08_GUITC|nr:hypothetical protein GUITHDRAFT_146998 [Guillardia theta CCMP2712]EKX34672.1 hypothetical protein GUITHDRAFT_146998 [Guillardia theta CCMP2712]|eukprot:XP_005821652.1 hypothetical protein GUITHDRAFT_146998 [Guillardia theta CCMP2712]